jgi:hypothetical protein
LSTRRAHDRPGRSAHRQLEDPVTVRRQVGGLHVEDREARGGAGRGCRPGRRRARRGTGGSWCDVAAPGDAAGDRASRISGLRWALRNLSRKPTRPPLVITWTGGACHSGVPKRRGPPGAVAHTPHWTQWHHGVPAGAFAVLDSAGGGLRAARTGDWPTCGRSAAVRRCTASTRALRECEHSAKSDIWRRFRNPGLVGPPRDRRGCGVTTVRSS